MTDRQLALFAPSAQPDTPAAPAARAADTSRAAADAIAGKAARYRRLALQAIREAGADGLTADEVADRLKVSVLTARPRVSELHKLRQVKDSGRRRASRGGNPMIVWIISEEANAKPD